jgi:hypothetical protein
MAWSGQASQHETDHGEAEEGGDGTGVALEVSRQATIATDPGEGSFHDPAFGQDDEAMRFGALDDLEQPAAGIGDGLCGSRALIASIGEDALDEGKRAARLLKDLADAIAVLHIGGVNDDAQEEAERVDEDVALAPRDFLARIIALRVERRAPF